MSTLQTNDLTLGYGDTIIINELDLKIPTGQITVIVGANGCGKSTLLSSLARLLKPKSGQVLLSGEGIDALSTKEVAKRLAILPQGPIAPDGLTVLQLVKQGRYPHQSWLKQWSREDEKVVKQVLAATKMEDLVDRNVNSLSGGQRQRAWLAMSLAQQTGIILLDEPTTFLDLAHQIEILDLLFELNEVEDRTVVMVLHDLNLACRYAHNIVAIQDKKIYAQGRPEDIVTREMVRNVFNLECEIVVDSLFGTPLCIPHGKGRRVQNKRGKATAV